MALADDTNRTPANWRLHLLLGTALMALASCWLWATPGPTLRGQSPDFETASLNAVIAFGWLFVYPLAVAMWLGIPIKTLGLQIGDWKFGVTAVLVSIPIACVLMYFGCDDAEIKAAYPWAGNWLGQSALNMACWFPIYLLYYVGFEFFFRGFLLRGLEKDMGLAVAMWFQVILSVSIHFGKPTPEILGAIPAGFLFGWIAYRSNSILYVVLIHWAIGIANDLFAMHYNGWLN